RCADQGNRRDRQYPGTAAETVAEHEDPERRAAAGRRDQTHSLQRVGEQAFRVAEIIWAVQRVLSRKLSPRHVLPLPAPESLSCRNPCPRPNCSPRTVPPHELHSEGETFAWCVPAESTGALDGD